MPEGTLNRGRLSEPAVFVFDKPLFWLLAASLLLFLSLLLFHTLTGASFPFLYTLLLDLFIMLPFVVLIKPSSFSYLLAVFLPLQQILLCLAFMHNRDWTGVIKWILGWKDLCVVVVLALAFLKLRNKTFAQRGWEKWIYFYIFFMALMIVRMTHPLMMTFASFRFNVLPFLFLLAGFYSRLNVHQVRSLLNVLFGIALIVVLFGVFEVSTLNEDFFYRHLDIGDFKIKVQETGQDEYVGSYLFAPGFLHKRRMVSTFLGATPAAHYLSFVLCLFLACLQMNVWRDRPFLHMGFILLLALAVFLTASRLAMAEALAACAFFTLISDRSKRTRYLLVGGIGLLGVLALYGGEIYEVASATLAVVDPSTSVHYQSVSNTPFTLIGEGLGVGANVFAGKGPYIIGEGIFNRLMIEIGMAGFLLFVLVYFVIIRAAVRYREIDHDDEGSRLARALNLAGALFGLIIIPSTFITIDLFSSVSLGLFWVFLGIGFRLHPSNSGRNVS